ncbi:hypothetical protein [uncultured Rhodospira sp.]|uniref:hypothetical protein n=1 Tax=uncultured Rhodospira sp. TaxID=1936189 RepID=UPI002627B21D|nr:hypothetical protein [uncultured Rhodospira sp.]
MPHCITCATALLLPLVVLAACGGGTAKMDEKTHMALYCQTTRCVCVEDTLVPFGAAKKQEPTWSLNGDPSCPQGFHLDAVDE